MLRQRLKNPINFVVLSLQYDPPKRRYIRLKKRMGDLLGLDRKASYNVFILLLGGAATDEHDFG